MFTHLNDTCEVKYSFKGQNCPITINVHNNLSQPIYVNWEKSYISIFDDTLSIWDKGTPEDNQNEPVSKIEPGASVEINPLNLITKFVTFLPEDKFKRCEYTTANGTASYKRYYFDTNNTPLYFRCVINYSAGATFNNEKYLEDHFWISEVIPSFSVLPVNKPYNFYLQKPTAISTVAGVAILAGLLILEVNMPDEGE